MTTSSTDAAAGRAIVERSRAIDLVRGLVMVVMVLDHARDFYAGFGDPTNLATTTPFLFFTRWITHFCAPGFVLLAGAAAHLYGRGKPPSALAWFLFTRGIWLVILEVTVVKIGWATEPYFFVMLQVIWAIGVSMIALAPLVWLPRPALVVFGIAMIALHNLLDGLEAGGPDAGQPSFLWAALHQRASFEWLPGHTVRVGYPLVPWIGVMAAGFGVGALFERPAAERQRALMALGVAISIGFVVLRASNLYGDPEPWSLQPNALYTVMSFINCEKYPPSLLYSMMTLGPLLLLVGAWDRAAPPEAIARPLLVFGRVPLFFYVAHLYLLRPPGVAMSFARFGAEAPRHLVSPELPLWTAYLAWAIAIAILYPICARYARFKERRSGELWWLKYL